MQKFYEPFVGKYYRQQKVKILVVAESHYVSECDRINLAEKFNINKELKGKDYFRPLNAAFIDYWYQNFDINTLEWTGNYDYRDPEYMETKQIGDKRCLYGLHGDDHNYFVSNNIPFNNEDRENLISLRKHKPYWFIGRFIVSAYNIHDYNNKVYIAKAMETYSYINYFPRPSLNGKTIKGYLSREDKEKDIKKAYEYFELIVNRIKPTNVIFLSKYAHHAFELMNGEKENDFIYDKFNHPSTPNGCYTRNKGSEFYRLQNYIAENLPYVNFE